MQVDINVVAEQAGERVWLSRDKRYKDIWIHSADPAGDFVPSHARKIQIDNDGVVRGALQYRKAIRSVSGCCDVMAIVLKDERHRFQDSSIVVNDTNSHDPR